VTLTASTTAPHPDDTIAAVSSAPGPGARAIVRVSGPKTRAVVGAVFRASGGRQPPDGGEIRGLTPPARQIVPGAVRLSGVHSPLPADLYFFPGPHSYTGQDVAELHTIGSPPLVERLVADLLAAGARPARPGEFTLRAFLAGKKDLPQAEAVHAVIEAGTDADLHAALAQLAGGVTQPLAALRDDLLNLLADLEAALDFADEDITFVGQTETLTRLAGAIARLTNLQRQLDARTVSGRPVRVALVGRPNAGKSSLFNALAGGPAALVSPEAGTTRDYLTRRLDLGGVAAELVDTAGWQAAADTIAEQAQRLGREQADRADVVVWCAEPGDPFDPADAARLAATGADVLRAQTKRDLASRVGHDPGSDVIACSVVTPGGTDALRAALAERVQSLARPPLAPSQSRCRHHVAACVAHLREAHRHVLFEDPAELTALALRSALDQLGEMVGAVYTNDLLDRIFSRFCIGK
jgi:tRNA modification GTPase